ncbi:MAG TPA: sigma-70 family RNA polymerase sigma factor [Sedimentisphaerales bacterium]|jgi:RNA polymerase sigma-70 factor (ECF subfamily)|nr:sigma-70 family RNA polymerase sigma factor [Sedimentisphaerales bacterium]HNU31829.1 sigma-70 family RNA polymerase sigma factor [Sedimentisphaerales bacterium]
MKLEDRYLVWQLKRSSEWALRRIYGRHETDLLALARSLLGRTGPAEDVLQDVFAKFIESIDSFELTGSLKGYLAQCVVNRARDYLRRDRCRAGEPLETAHQTPSRQHGPLDAAIAGEQRERLIVALAELPDEQREVVLLHLHGGVRFRKIARMQGVSAKTAWSRYRYGLDRLRSMLNGQVEP